MATFTVTTTADEAFGGGTLATEAADGTGLSLREAVGLANTSSGADTIEFDPSLNGAVLRLTNGQLTITDELIIDGASAGANGVIISGDALGNDRDASGAIGAAGTGITDIVQSAGFLGDNSRVFEIDGTAASVEMTGLTVTGGRSGIYALDGGGILVRTDLTLTDVLVHGNVAAGVYVDGGGIALRSSASTLTLYNSTVSGNATFDGMAQGGGIYSSGDVRLYDSTITSNWTDGDGAEGGGMAVFSGDVFLTRSAVTDNTTTGLGSDGGGIYVSQGNVVLADSLIDGNSVAFGTGGGMYLGDGELTITDSAVTGNSARGGGGGFFLGGGVLTITDSTVSGNSTGRRYGGGFSVENADGTLTGSTIMNNYAARDGGGIFADGSDLTITQSTIAGNSARDDGGGLAVSSGSARIINSTIAGNTVFVEGGGILNQGTLDLVNSTVTGNYAGDEGGGIGNDGSATITNSLVTGNASGVGGATNDLFNSGSGSATYAGGNIIGGTLYEASGAYVSGGITADQIFDQTTNVNGTGVLGGVLADNGGPVQTVALLKDVDNPAFDGSDDSLAVDDMGNLILTDARGFDRSVDQAPAGANDIDLGAFEAINLIIGTGGDDTITGTLEADCIIGLAGDDEISGRGGDDEITGSRDADIIFGDNGNDTINGAAGADVIEGGNGGDRISGGNQDDEIHGGNANDTLFGGDGDDFLSGGNQNDGLQGGNGNDTLSDGDNRDTLTGGDGADLFVLDTDAFRDKITDFENGVDLIQLTGVTFADLTIFDIGTGAVRINYSTDVLILQENGGPVDAVDIDAGDFIFV